jgi:iron complex outermembrane recepter protein
MRRSRVLFAFASTSALSLAAGQALAQPAPPPPPNAIGEVVVTAEPRTQNLQTAPIAAVVLSNEELDRKNIDSIDDLEFSTPSLTVSSSGQGNSMNIRGIGKNSIAGNTTSAVATYRDGIGTISGFFNGEPYYDVATVEVLRGPQGTFVGQNAAGGAIFVNTRDPVLGRVDGFAEAGIGNYDSFEFTGAISIPLGETFAARIAFRHSQRDSFFDVFTDAARTQRHPEHVGAQDLNSLRLGLLWAPMDTLEVKFKLDLSELDNHGYAFGVVPGFPNAAPMPTNISGDPFVVGNNFFDNYAVDRLARGALDIRYTLPGGIKLRSLSGAQYINTYIRNDDDGSLNRTQSQHIRAIFRIYSQELTLLSPEDQRLRWIAGAYANIETLYFPEDDGFVGTTNGVPTIQIKWRTPRQTEAVYGQVSFDITDALEVQAGLRYNHYRVSQNVIIGFPTLNCAVALCKQNVHEEEQLTGKLALNYTLNENHFLYAFVATGHTTGGVNLVPGIPNYEPTIVTDYEAGWKATLMNGQLRTQLGVFYNDIKDYQINYLDVTTGRSAYQNLHDDSYIRGVEFTAQARIGDFSGDIGIALIDSELGDAQVFDSVLGRAINPKGNPHPFTPNYTVNIGVEYAFHVLGGTLSPRVDFSWVDTQTLTATDRITAAGVPIDRIFKHDLVNASLVYERAPWRATAFVTNLTKEEYIEAHGGPGYNAYPNEPRRFGLRVHREF